MTPKEIIELIDKKWADGTLEWKDEQTPQAQFKYLWKIIRVKLKGEDMPKCIPLNYQEYKEFRQLQEDVLGLKAHTVT